jgi:hypothetical protein
MEIKNKLIELGFNSNNCIVIGSGILNALNLRESKDIDIVVTHEKYKELSSNSQFKKEQKFGSEILTDELFEIMTTWNVIGKAWTFSDLQDHSIVIEDVRYNTVEFLLDVKREWVSTEEARQKDIDDIALMEKFLTIQ